jgi:hypothetical protein
MSRTKVVYKGDTSLTPKLVIHNENDGDDFGKVWDAAAEAWVAFDSDDFSDYYTSLTESTADESGFYSATFPSAIAAGQYGVRVLAGDAYDDEVLDTASYVWDGSALYALDEVRTAVAAVKAKTDGLNFSGGDVKATLDGEEVTTDSASREASRATGFAEAGDKMDLADSLNADGVADLKSKLGTVPASGDWNTTAPPTADAIRNAILDRVLSGNHDTAGTAGKLLQDTAADVAGLDGEGMRGTDGAYTGTPPTADAIRNAILDRVLSGNHDTAGTAGKLLQYLDVAVSSRSSLDAAAIRTAIGLAAANLDTQLAAILVRMDPNVDIDTETSPFELVLTNKTTGDELLRQKLYQIDGTPVTSADHLVAKKEAVT